MKLDWMHIVSQMPSRLQRLRAYTPLFFGSPRRFMHAFYVCKKHNNTFGGFLVFIPNASQNAF